MAILVVVDMQTGFPAARDRKFRERVIRRVQRHRERGWPVLFLEYHDYGPTLPSIANAAPDAPRKTKTTDSGFQEVLDAMIEHRWFRHRVFVICGVNTPFCVLDTARDVLRLHKTWRVVLPVWCCRNHRDMPSFGQRTGQYVTEVAIEMFVKEDPKRRKILWDRDKLT